MTQTMTWATALIGIPFVEHGRSMAGCDCWGLVRLALAIGFGVTVPDYTEEYATTTDREEIHALVTQESLGWLQVPAAASQPGDVVLFRMQGRVCHAGIVLEAPYFLHCQKDIGSALERWDAPLWRRRLDSVIRHHEMAGRAE